MIKKRKQSKGTDLHNSSTETKEKNSLACFWKLACFYGMHGVACAIWRTWSTPWQCEERGDLASLPLPGKPAHAHIPLGLTTASRAHPTVFVSTSHMLGWHLLECICHTCSGCWNHCACVWMDYVINSSRCVRAPLLFCPASAPHPKQGRWQNNLQYRMLCQYTLKKQAFE